MLLVDDIEAELALLAAILENIGGLQLLMARDGAEALETARRDNPDIILLDVMMPKMNGYEVCLALKRDPATAQAKVVVITGLDQEFDRQKALSEVGADHYMLKPFSPAALLETVERLLALP